MNEPTETGDTQFILPILCQHCGKEINLAMSFALLPQDAKVPEEPLVDDNNDEDEPVEEEE